MGAVIDLEKIRVQKEKSWFRKIVDAAKYKVKKAYWWVKNNPAEAAILGTIVTTAVGGAVKVSKGLVRTHNLNKEAYNKDRYVYDHSLGAYLKTTRKLNNNDIVEINRRMAEGKKKAEVLAEMGLLE